MGTRRTLLPLGCLVLLLAGCGLTPASTGATGDLSATRSQRGDRSLTLPSPTTFVSTPTATATAYIAAAAGVGWASPPDAQASGYINKGR